MQLADKYLCKGRFHARVPEFQGWAGPFEDCPFLQVSLSGVTSKNSPGESEWIHHPTRGTVHQQRHPMHLCSIQCTLFGSVVQMAQRWASMTSNLHFISCLFTLRIFASWVQRAVLCGLGTFPGMFCLHSKPSHHQNEQSGGKQALR